MKITIIIPNYNGASLLEHNIPYVISALDFYIKESSNKGEIIVIDDASTDESLQILDKFAENIQVIKNTINRGFAASVNKAIQQSNGEIVVLLNSDVRPEKEFLIPLIKRFENNESLFAVGCMDKSIEGTDIIKRGRGMGRWHRGFLVHSAGNIEKENTLWASGGSSAFRKSIWNQLGGFSLLYYPFYWEDIDISYRAWKAEFTVAFEKESIVTHEHEKGAIKTKYNNFYIQSTAYKNQFIFVWSNITDVSLRINHVLWLPYYFLRAVMHFDLAFYMGFFRALLLLPNIIKSNISSKFSEVRTDKEILSLFKS